MRFSGPKNHLQVIFFTIGLATLACVFPLRAEAQGNQADAEKFLAIPGGFAGVARVIGLNQSIDPDRAIERLFGSILESEPPAGSLSGANSTRRDLISYLRQYDQLLRYLEKEHLASGSGDSGLKSIRFLMAGREQDLKNTRKLLAFFGIESRLRTVENGSIAQIETTGNRGSQKNRILSGVFQLRDSRELQIGLEPEKLPMILDTGRWAKILPGKGLLLQRFLENPEAMRLYLALAACSETTREALVNAVEPARLLKYSEALLLFGSDLRFENGALTFPGSRQAWNCLPGTPALSANALFSAGGIPLLLYSSVSAAPPPVQQYLTASADRLESYFAILRPYASGGFNSSVATLVGQDLPRILRQLRVDSSGMLLDLGDISTPLLHWMAPDEVPGNNSGPVLMNPKILSRLLPRPGVSPYSQSSRADTIEFFRHLKNAQPGSLSADSIEDLMKSPEEAPVFLDLIGDLVPEGPLLSEYLEYCARAASGGSEGWNLSRSRTSESIFFLLSALRREGTLSHQKANDLLQEALQAFAPEDESAFAFNVADFVSAKLVPAVSGPGNSADALLAALAGDQSSRQISFAGRELFLNQGAGKYRNMRDVLQSQSYTPIPVLLELYGLLRQIENVPADKADEMMRRFSERLNDIRTAESTPGELKEQKNFIAQSRIDAIKREIVSAGSWTASQDSTRMRARQIAADLHTELGVTLLAYCYAYSAAPGIHVLAYDPNFVRKHRFYRLDRLKKPTWSRSHFVQEDMIGGFIEGSLAGLGFELTRLQIAQSDQDFGISANINIAPAILYGIRQIPSELRTDRSQAYVAIATQLGDGLISVRRISDPLEKWIERTLTPLLSEQRLEEMEDRGNALLSRSELFLLGHAYFNSRKWGPGECTEQSVCPAIEKLKEIVPNPGSVEYNAFLEEVNQYGVFLGSRTGLSRFSFDMIDSYERLQKNLHPQYLYDRLCDLKIRIAELNYSLGLPASLGEMEADEALDRILEPASQASVGDWKYTIERINGLTEKAALGWIDKLALRGSLTSELEKPQRQGL